MIDLPIGKAIVAVEEPKGLCKGCYFLRLANCPMYPNCCAETRKDGKNVMFKIVDYKENP